MKRAIAWLVALALITGVVACRPSAIGDPTAGMKADEPLPAAVAQISPVATAPGKSTLVVSINWPRRIASLPPETDRVSFELTGPANVSLPLLPTIFRPDNGSLLTLFTVLLPAVAGIKIRGTAYFKQTAVSQSLWSLLDLRRNTQVDAKIELLPLVPPTISSVSPDRGYPGFTIITLVGTNFGYGQGLGAVTFGEQEGSRATSWSEPNKSGADKIVIVIPPNAQTGAVKVRIGGHPSTSIASFNGVGPANDPWGAHFSVLGPAGDLGVIELGDIGDHMLASDGARFWSAWTRKSNGTTQLFAAKLALDAQLNAKTATLGTPIGLPQVTGDIVLGGLAVDPSGAWITWEEVERHPTTRNVVRKAVNVAHLGFDDGLKTIQTTLSTSPSDDGQPTIARLKDGRMLVVWIDAREPNRQRVYGQALTSQGALSGAVILVQDDTTSQVGSVCIATSGTQYLVAWQAPGLGVQLQGYEGHTARLTTVNRGLPGSGSRLQVKMDYNLKTDQYAILYSQQNSSTNATSSDLYMVGLDLDGTQLFGPEAISQEGTRTDFTGASSPGQVPCPSQMSKPCGLGFRRSPQFVWNGRDHFVVWQFDRTDGETDIIGARLQSDGKRAPEEPESAHPTGVSPRSVAEALISYAGTGTDSQPNSKAGPQTLPRIAWGGDTHIVAWVEPSSKQLVYRLWR